jgi:hypothetical protein
MKLANTVLNANTGDNMRIAHPVFGNQNSPEKSDVDAFRLP